MKTIRDLVFAVLAITGVIVVTMNESKVSTHADPLIVKGCVLHKQLHKDCKYAYMSAEQLASLPTPTPCQSR